MTDFSSLTNPKEILSIFLKMEATIDENDEQVLNSLQADLSNLWKQMRLLVTQIPHQESTREFFMVDENFVKVIIKTHHFQQKGFFTKCSVDSYFLQFLANFITANSRNQAFIIEHLVEARQAQILHASKDLTAHAFKDAKLRKFLCTFLYNFLKGIKSEVFLEKVLPSTVFQMILRGILVEFLKGEEESLSGKEVEKQEIEVSYMSLLLISLLFKLSDSISLCKAIQQLLIVRQIAVIFYEKKGLTIIADHPKNMSLSEIAANRSYEQFCLFLFHINQKFVDAKAGCSFVKALEPTIIDVRCEYVNKLDYQFQISEKDLEFLCNEFQDIVGIMKKRLSEVGAFEHSDGKIQENSEIDGDEKDKKEELPDEQNKNASKESEKQSPAGNVNDFAISEHQVTELTNYLNAIHDKLRLFCITSFLGGYNSKLQKYMLHNNTLQSVLEFIQTLQKVNSVDFIQGKALITQKKRCLRYFHKDAYQDIFSSAMRFLSNLVHIHREAQDYIFREGYLVTCLSQTSMDETNPLQREWSVMLIRNLCDSNNEVQDAISNLKIGDFSDKTQEILQKFQVKREELEQVRKAMEEGKLARKDM